MDSGRVDPEDVINELMEDLHLDSSTATEGNYSIIHSFMHSFICVFVSSNY